MLGHHATRSLVVTSPPATEPITLASAKLQCRVDADNTLDDPLIEALIVAAREYGEKRTRRSFVARSYQLRLDAFPCGISSASLPHWSLEQPHGRFSGLLQLPKPPLISVDSIVYLDQSGTAQTLPPSAYHVEAGGVGPGTVTPAYGTAFPVAQRSPGSVVVAFTAGYDPPTTVPASLCQAMLLIVAHWYRTREAVVDRAMSPVPLGADALLGSLDWGFYA